MLTVHHLGISQSDRIVWLCEELGMPYELQRHERDPVTRMAPPAFHALHPLGTAPIITDDGLVLAETGAIVEYILAKYDGVHLAARYPEPEFAPYLFWFHFSNGSFMPRGMSTMIAKAMNPGGAGSLLEGRRENAFKMVEQRLGEAAYFAGDRFTAADIMMVFPLTTMRLFAPFDLSAYPNILSYLQRIAARPAFQEAMRKADPDLPLQLT